MLSTAVHWGISSTPLPVLLCGAKGASPASPHPTCYDSCHHQGCHQPSRKPCNQDNLWVPWETQANTAVSIPRFAPSRGTGRLRTAIPVPMGVTYPMG